MAHHKNNKANNQQTLKHPAFSSPNIKTKRATSKHLKKTFAKIQIKQTTSIYSNNNHDRVHQTSNKANNTQTLKQPSNSSPNSNKANNKQTLKQPVYGSPTIQ